MRKIEYIFIDSDHENDTHKSGRHVVPNFGYHFVVNSQGCVINPTDISLTANIIQGPVYDPDKYNKCSIFIRYCGSIRSEAWLLEPVGTLNPATRSLRVSEGRTTLASAMLNVSRLDRRSNLKQRQALISLLVELRRHFPEAKILGVSEIDGRELYCKNIIVSDAMNQIRRELSDLP